MANEDVYEESKLTIKVALKAASHKDTDTAQIVLTVDGVEQAPIDVEVKKQWVVHEHTFAKVPDDKDSYPVTYRIAYDGESKPGAQEFTVWPRTVHLTLINDVNGDPVARKNFALRHDNGQVAYYITNPSGAAECLLKHKCAFTVRPSGALNVKGWTSGKEHGRRREARVEVVEFVAKFDTPAWATQTVVQSVNVATAKTNAEVGHDKRGPRIACNVKLANKAYGDPGTIRGGERVYVKATFSELTKRTARKGTLEGVTGLSTAGDVVTGYVSTASGKGAFVLVLGMGGKEKCKLEIGTTPECKDASFNVENMRTIWLQTIARAGQVPSLAGAKGAFAKVAIDMQRDPDVEIDNGNAPANAIVPGATLGEVSDQLIVGDHNCTLFGPLWTKDHDPLSAYAIFCDYQFDAGAAPLTKDFAFDVDPPDTVNWPPTGADVRGFPTTLFAAGSSKALLDRNLHDGLHAITNARWKSLALVGPHVGKTGNLATDCFHIDWGTPADRGRLFFKASPEMCVLLADGDSVKLKFTVTYAKGPYMGWAPSNPAGGVVIALKCSGPSSVNSMNATVTHEIGHVMNQVDPAAAGTGLDRDADHGWHYVDRGHSGGHCAFGIAKGTYDAGGDLDTGVPGAACTMFGEDCTPIVIDFCVKCAPFVLAEPIETLA